MCKRISHSIKYLEAQSCLKKIYVFVFNGVSRTHFLKEGTLFGETLYLHVLILTILSPHQINQRSKVLELFPDPNQRGIFKSEKTRPIYSCASNHQKARSIILKKLCLVFTAATDLTLSFTLKKKSTQSQKFTKTFQVKENPLKTLLRYYCCAPEYKAMELVLQYLKLVGMSKKYNKRIRFRVVE